MPTLRIGVLSDTHGPLPESVFDLMSGAWSEGELNGRLWRQALCRHEGGGSLSLEEAVIGQEGRTEPLRPLSSRRCGLIAHCGDIGPQSVLDELGAIARTVAVLGNNDYATYWCSDGTVQDHRSLTVDGVNLFVQHIPQEMELSLHGRPPLRPALVTTQPDLAIHGHTHVPRLEAHGTRITLCPGSPTRARRGSGHAAALVDIEDGRIVDIYLVRLP